MLADQSLDREEADELLALLRDLTGEQGQQARGAMPTNLAFDNPMPEITFSQTFILTGTFQSGLRKDIEKKLMALGASIGSNVIQNPCCLIVGSLVTPAWIHSTHGRKLEKAVAYREEGHPVKIISEDHLWGEIERLGLISEESLPKSSPQGLPEPDEAVTGRAGECLTLLGSPKE
jgi:NAD-dependent DNA ligase